MVGLKTLSQLSLERKVYLLVMVAFSFASLSVIFAASGNGASRSLGPGWTLLSRKQDIADFEWTFWFSDLRESVLLGLIGHVIVSCVAAKCIPWAKEALLAFYCAYCVRNLLGEAFVALAVTICLILHVIFAVSKSKTMCWAVTVSSVLLLHFDGFYMQVLPSALETNDSYLSLAYGALGFGVLRCCSFHLERIRDATDEKYGLLRLLKYNFYLPYFFFGPIMTYDVFSKKRVDHSMAKSGIGVLLKESLKIMLGVVAVDFLLHFIHVSSIAVDSKFLEAAPVYAVGCILFFNVLLDWMKAAVLYGITSRVTAVADGHMEAPQAPKCTATICTFADTYFDRGIQHWVSRYVYDVIGEEHTDLAKETCASAATFLFVTIWQGPNAQVIVWAILNCLGLTFEFFIAEMTPKKDKTRKRLVAFILGINYWCILFFNSVGINGIETARISARSIFLSGNHWNTFCALLLSYCYAAFLLLTPDSKDKRE